MLTLTPDYYFKIDLKHRNPTLSAPNLKIVPKGFIVYIHCSIQRLLSFDHQIGEEKLHKIYFNGEEKGEKPQEEQQTRDSSSRTDRHVISVKCTACTLSCCIYNLWV